MKVLHYNNELWTQDPHLLLMQIVYYFSSILEDNPSPLDDDQFRCVYCPWEPFLYVGLMQAMAFSVLDHQAKEILFLVQWDHEEWIIAPESNEIIQLLWDKFSINKKLLEVFDNEWYSIKEDDSQFENLWKFWYLLPFCRIWHKARNVLPLILPKNQEGLVPFLSELIDSRPGLVVYFSWSLSQWKTASETKLKDDKILAQCLIGWPSEDFPDAPLFSSFCALSQRQWKEISYEYYENSYSVGWKKNNVTGYVVAGY